MKKLVKKIVVLAAVAAMGLSMIACGKKYKSVADYVKSDEVQEVISSFESEYAGSGMSISITADGDKMVYSYKYDNVEKVDGMAESLESAVAAEEATFQETADELKKVVDVKSPSVVIEYIDANGEVIFTKEYVAK